MHTDLPDSVESLSHLGDIASMRPVACGGRVTMSVGRVQHRLVHHRFQAAGRIAAQVEIRKTRNGHDAATSATAATKPHGHLSATEELLQLIGQRATSCGQVFGLRGLLHQVQNGRGRTGFPGGCMRHVETHAGIMLGMRYCCGRLGHSHDGSPQRVRCHRRSHGPSAEDHASRTSGMEPAPRTLLRGRALPWSARH